MADGTKDSGDRGQVTADGTGGTERVLVSLEDQIANQGSRERAAAGLVGDNLPKLDLISKQYAPSLGEVAQKYLAAASANLGARYTGGYFEEFSPQDTRNNLIIKMAAVGLNHAENNPKATTEQIGKYLDSAMAKQIGEQISWQSNFVGDEMLERAFDYMERNPKATVEQLESHLNKRLTRGKDQYQQWSDATIDELGREVLAKELAKLTHKAVTETLGPEAESMTPRQRLDKIVAGPNSAFSQVSASFGELVETLSEQAIEAAKANALSIVQKALSEHRELAGAKSPFAPDTSARSAEDVIRGIDKALIGAEITRVGSDLSNLRQRLEQRSTLNEGERYKQTQEFLVGIEKIRSLGQTNLRRGYGQEGEVPFEKAAAEVVSSLNQDNFIEVLKQEHELQKTKAAEKVIEGLKKHFDLSRVSMDNSTFFSELSQAARRLMKEGGQISQAEQEILERMRFQDLSRIGGGPLGTISREMLGHSTRHLFSQVESALSELGGESESLRRFFSEGSGKLLVHHLSQPENGRDRRRLIRELQVAEAMEGSAETRQMYKTAVDVLSTIEERSGGPQGSEIVVDKADRLTEALNRFGRVRAAVLAAAALATMVGAYQLSRGNFQKTVPNPKTLP